MNKLQIIPICFIVIFALGCEDPYEKAIAEAGFRPLKSPRQELGTGTIYRPMKDREFFIAAPQECFPGLEAKIIPNEQILMKRGGDSKFDIGANAKYLLLGKLDIEAAFGFSNAKKYSLEWGPARGNVLTVQGLTTALEDLEVPRSCLEYLRNPDNRIVMQALQPSFLKYNFEGAKATNVDLSVLDSVFGGNLNYTVNQDKSLTVDKPMYVGAFDVEFKDTGIRVPEDATASFRLEKGSFTLQASRRN